MDIQVLVGMPLWYAKSVLEKNSISYSIEETVARSRFFSCNESEKYVIRSAVQSGKAVLLVNSTMAMSDSVIAAINDLEGMK